MSRQAVETMLVDDQSASRSFLKDGMNTPDADNANYFIGTGDRDTLLICTM